MITYHKLKMIKKLSINLIFIFLTFIHFNNLSSKEFNYICINESDFMIVFNINLNSKIIVHTKSRVSENDTSSNAGQVYEVNELEEIFLWDYPRVWTYQWDEGYDNFTFREFNFQNNTMKFTSLDSEGTDGNFYYNCFVS